jgi:hypothetical protein
MPESDLCQALNDEYRGGVDLFGQDEQTRRLLQPGQIDEDDLLAEFHGGPPYNPETLPALREALSVLRANVEALEAEEILLARSAWSAR